MSIVSVISEKKNVNSQTILEKYRDEIVQPLLWVDYDLVLRKTYFKDINPEFNQKALAHWWLNVYVPDGYGDDNTPQEVYRSWSNAIYSNFKYITAGGYNPETHQQTVSFGCIKNEPTSAHLAELNLWVPYIKLCKDENGRGERKAKYIKIFESTLSQYGCYNLSIYSDNEFVIGKLVYSCGQAIKSFTNLEDAVDYIRKNIWYKKKFYQS